MDIELRELKKEFLEEAEAKIVEIKSRINGDGGGKPSPESMQRVGDLAHQLKGAGGSYGYAEISSHAAKLEDAIESLNHGEADAESVLEQLVETLATEIISRRKAIVSGSA
ncbi:MAG: Hpt domain-containing protein [Acidobacteria bacterium]|nr:Hpt domain-containing protein [Acidobacteriota bacterium]